MAANPKMEGTRAFHNNITAALNADSATVRPTKNLKCVFMLIFTLNGYTLQKRLLYKPAQHVGHFLAKYPIGANFDTLFTPHAALCIFKHNVPVPQKRYFANRLPRAGADALPARCTFFWVCPNVLRPDAAELAHSFFHFLLF
jgi:hypothetical protein